MNWYKIAKIQNYLDIGHGKNTQESDQWLILENENDYISQPAHNNLHVKYQGNNNTEFGGRIDHKNKTISISKFFSPDLERVKYLVSLFKMDFPDYKIYFFDESLHSDPKRMAKCAQYEVEDEETHPQPALSDREYSTIEVTKIDEREYPVAAVVIANDIKYEGRNHGEAIQKGKDDGHILKDKDGYLIDTSGNDLSFSGATDLFKTNKGRIINRFEAFQLGEATSSEHIPPNELDVQKSTTTPSISTTPFSEVAITPRQVYIRDNVIQNREDLTPSKLRKKKKKKKRR